MKKRTCSIFGPYIGELGWEITRFAPHVIWYKKKNPSNLVIVCTRPDRYDLYGQYCDGFYPVTLKLDPSTSKLDCHGVSGKNPDSSLNDFIESYEEVAFRLRKELEKFYNIHYMFYPAIRSSKYKERWQFSPTETNFDFSPRVDNELFLSSYLSSFTNGNKEEEKRKNNRTPLLTNSILDYLQRKKNLICLAPRKRQDIPSRNWSGWEEFYALISKERKSLLEKDFLFILCSKEPDYFKPSDSLLNELKSIRDDITGFPFFLDLNDCVLDPLFMHYPYASFIGLVLEVMKRSKLVLGSISALPVLGFLVGVPVLTWGVQRLRHCVNLNPFLVPVTFIDSVDFGVSPQEIFYKMLGLVTGTMSFDFNDHHRNDPSKVRRELNCSFPPGCLDSMGQVFFSL